MTRLRLILALVIVMLTLAPLAGTAHAEPMYLLKTANRIATFDSGSPGTLSADTPVTGLGGSESLEAIDVRPANGQLYGVARMGTSARIYRIDPVTGAATAISPSFTVAGAGYGMDFNPVSDRVRVVTGGDTNVRIHPDTGTVFPDTGLGYAAGDPNAGADPGVTGLAHSSNFPGATSTTAFGYDFNGAPNRLARLGGADGAAPSPNLGQLFTIANPSVSTGDSISLGLDIGPGGTAFLLLRAPPTNLYQLDFATGTATSLGQIGDATNTKLDIAAFPVSNVIQFRAADYAAGEEAGTATIAVTRSSAIGAASVSYATSDGSAEAATDYTPSSGVLNFQAGQDAATFDVPITRDAQAEGAETVNLTLSNPNGGVASLGGQSTAVLTIANDPAPTLSGVGASRTTFRVGSKATTVGISARRRAKVGTTFSYTVSEGAIVTITINQVRRGKVRKRGTLTRSARAGKNKTKFTGRIGKKRLAAGRYRAVFEAMDDAGNRSRQKTVKFRVVKR